jgi:hypothetical protein
VSLILFSMLTQIYAAHQMLGELTDCLNSYNMATSTLVEAVSGPYSYLGLQS